MKAHALWSVGPGVAELRDEALAVPGPDQVLVRSVYSALSRGTERLVLWGRVPASEWQRMRAPLQVGEFPFPVKYGYSVAGIAESGALRGQGVFCLHPHQDRFIAPAAMCVPVPPEIPLRRAVLAANMETAVNILWDAQPLPGERALVMGAGVVGLLVAYLLARIPGLSVVVVDRDTSRAAVVAGLGLPFALPGEAAMAPEGGFDLIVNATGSPSALPQAIAHAGFEARIIEASWHGAQEAVLPLGGAFHALRLRLISSQVGQVAPAMRGRRSYAERLALALRLLADSALDALLGPEVAFGDLPQRLAQLLEGDPAPLCPLVRYPADTSAGAAAL